MEVLDKDKPANNVSMEKVFFRQTNYIVLVQQKVITNFLLNRYDKLDEDFRNIQCVS